MKKINFYIGSNNKTKELEKDKALKILSNTYEGMSITELIGVWKGIKENTLLVSVITDKVDYTQVKQVCKTLNKELEQEAIMIEVLNSNALFISEH
jgi:hypothetical protein